MAYHLLGRMNFVRRKATTSKSKHTPQNFSELKETFLNDIAAVVGMEEIIPELVLNWDQTGIHLVPASAWTMDKMGSKRVEISGINDKRQITAVFCGSAAGDFLPLQLVYKGKTSRCHLHFQFPAGWLVSHSPKHWSTEETMIEYIEIIIIPYVESYREFLNDPNQSAVVIMDNFKGQVTTAVNNLLDAHNIYVCLIPPNTTDVLQPMDASVNKPAKDFLKRKFEEWYSNEVTKQLHGITNIKSVELQPIDFSMASVKELSAKWLVEMSDYIANNPQFIVHGFRRCGILKAMDRCHIEEDSEPEVEQELLSDDDVSENDKLDSIPSDDSSDSDQ